MRNINNIYETRAVEILDPISKEAILRIRTLSKAKDVLGMKTYRQLSAIIGTGKVLFSKKLNKNVIINDYKEVWQAKQHIILLKDSEKKM